ncbi:MAG: C45 family peptidase [Chloroflexi bacterium]|nr:C45 family peptidase [Chloroflexota bacterium]
MPRAARPDDLDRLGVPFAESVVHREGGIPFLVVSGSHREVGRQVGLATAEVLREAVAFDEALPAGRSRADQLNLAARYREVTLAATPWLVEELDGAAEGAGVDPLALFAASIEEIWTVRPSQATAGLGVDGRCSDLVAAPPATPDGHVWIAHNNDLSAASEAAVIAIEWRVPGEPVVFSLGIGPWISVGWNSAGLSLTGNELAPNDERIGIPRLPMVREQLTAHSLDEAVAMALRPDRASSYNTVFAHRDGRVVNVEGSATDVEVTGPSAAGTLAHTNHYVCERMLGYEGDPAYAKKSAVRLGRALELLDGPAGAGPAAGSLGPEQLLAAISDHATSPSICRHDDGSETSATAFWCLADVTAGEIRYGLGAPCKGLEARYRFG